MSITSHFVDIICAYILDLLIGDPYWIPHPVRLIGFLINACKKLLRHTEKKAIDIESNYNHKGLNKDTTANRAFLTDDKASKKSYDKDRVKTNRDRVEFIKGILLAIIVVGATVGTICLILWLASLIHPILLRIVNIYIIYSAIATKCLATEAKKMARVLKGKDIGKSREMVAMLVGRDTSNLSEEQITKAVVETTAENTVDGVVSPLLFAIAGAFFGISAPLVYLFKAISTLDSMVGYKNQEYMFFGRASARIDDALNFIPARITGILIPIASLLLQKIKGDNNINYKNAFRIMYRDRRNHKSPNCAYPEAAVAGALGIRLGGPSIYFGELVEKPYIGDDIKPIEVIDINKTVMLMYYTATLVILPIILYVIIGMWQ